MNSHAEAQPRPPLVVYQYLPEHHIHELIFLQSSRQAVDLGVEHVMRIYQGLTNDSQVNLLIDLRQSKLLPMNNVIPIARSWGREIKIHPQVRLALLTRPDPLTTMIKSIFDMLRFGHLRTQVFQDIPGTNPHDQAVAWLVHTL